MVAPASAASALTGIGAVCDGRNGVVADEDVVASEGVTGAVTIRGRVRGELKPSGEEGYRRCTP